MKVGRRLAMKVLNVSKFVLGSVGATDRTPDLVTEPVDRALLGKLARTLARGHARVRGLRLHHRARGDRAVLLGLLRRLRRAGQGAGVRRRRAPPATESAKAALAIALHVQLRLFAPFLPYVTEEVWSWWQPGSVHLQAWPTADELGDAAAADPAVLDAVAAVLAGVRGAKSTAKVGMRTPVEQATITGPADALEAIRSAERDLRAVGSITGELDLVAAEDSEIRVDAVLGEPPPKRVSRRPSGSAQCPERAVAAVARAAADRGPRVTRGSPRGSCVTVVRVAPAVGVTLARTPRSSPPRSPWLRSPRFRAPWFRSPRSRPSCDRRLGGRCWSRPAETPAGTGSPWSPRPRSPRSGHLGHGPGPVVVAASDDPGRRACRRRLSPRLAAARVAGRACTCQGPAPGRAAAAAASPVPRRAWLPLVARLVGRGRGQPVMRCPARHRPACHRGRGRRALPGPGGRGLRRGLSAGAARARGRPRGRHRIRSAWVCGWGARRRPTGAGAGVGGRADRV